MSHLRKESYFFEVLLLTKKTQALLNYYSFEAIEWAQPCIYKLRIFLRPSNGLSIAVLHLRPTAYIPQHCIHAQLGAPHHTL